jgi:hypothetical protein
VHEEERRREGPDRVSGGGCGESAKDGCEGNKCEEDEEGGLDSACTCRMGSAFN